MSKKNENENTENNNENENNSNDENQQDINELMKFFFNGGLNNIPDFMKNRMSDMLKEDQDQQFKNQLINEVKLLRDENKQLIMVQSNQQKDLNTLKKLAEEDNSYDYLNTFVHSFGQPNLSSYFLNILLFALGFQAKKGNQWTPYKRYTVKGIKTPALYKVGQTFQNKKGRPTYKINKKYIKKAVDKKLKTIGELDNFYNFKDLKDRQFFILRLAIGKLNDYELKREKSDPNYIPKYFVGNIHNYSEVTNYLKNNLNLADNYFYDFENTFQDLD